MGYHPLRDDAESSPSADESDRNEQSHHAQLSQQHLATGKATHGTLYLLLGAFLLATCVGGYLIFFTPIAGPPRWTPAEADPTSTASSLLSGHTTESSVNASPLRTTPTLSSSIMAPSHTAVSSSSPSSEPSASTGTSASPGADGAEDMGVNTPPLKKMGISTFLGNNTGGIASWYHAKDPKDSTNGRSWCEFDYNDAVPGFAPSLKTMLASFNQDSVAAKKAFCGLEAKVYSPATGKTVTLYIADAFDDEWVRTPASIDVMYDSFAEVYGSKTDDKNDVVKEVSWQLTGNRNDKYTYKAAGTG
ncbi:hypothetical protein JCM10908_005937 [Rhodotorula pacifica]|uniref:uncharacterized protein n=1 Tax=Rhodotorula pacifica TaxID=1495444 RepID=UPI00317717BB